MRVFLAIALGVLATVATLGVISAEQAWTTLVVSDDIASAPVAYCTSMGYQVKIDSLTNTPHCWFDQSEHCATDTFYRNECGAPYQKPIPPREEGQTIHPEFQVCKEGLVVSDPRYALDQPRCVGPSFWERIWSVTRI